MKRIIFLSLWVYYILFAVYFILGFFNISFSIFGYSIYEMIVLETSYVDIAKQVIYLPLIPLIFIARHIELSNDLYEVFTLSLLMIAATNYFTKD